MLGNTGAKLGAGRSKATDPIAYEVGFKLLKSIGDKIEKSNPLFMILYYDSID
jgi:thymidine phosphorylase